MSRTAAYREKYRAEVVEASRECQRVIVEGRRALVAEYRKAFAALLRAGERYDRTVELGEPRFEDISLFGVDPDDVAGFVDLVPAEEVAEAMKNVRASL